MTKEKDFPTITNRKGIEIPKYYKDFKELVKKDRDLAEHLSMNYEEMDSEDLGAMLELLTQGFSWIIDLLDSRDLSYKARPKKYEKAEA